MRRTFVRAAARRVATVLLVAAAAAGGAGTGLASAAPSPGPAASAAAGAGTGTGSAAGAGSGVAPALPAPRPVPGVPPASADGTQGATQQDPPQVAAARAAARAVAARVAALQIATEVAVERYNGLQAELRAAGLRHAAALRNSQAARVKQVRADRVAQQRLRDLYISGGPPGLLDLTIGSSGSAGAGAMDLFHRYDDSRYFLAQDRLRFAAAEAAALRSALAEQALAAAVTEQRRLTAAAAAATREVRRQLAEQQALLDSAGAAVRAVLATDQRAELRSAAALAGVVRDVTRRTGTPALTTADTRGVSAVVSRVLAAAERQLGKPYAWGATGPASYDCSGLVQYAFAAAGVALPRTSREQWYAGSHPAVSAMAPGDLLFWANGTDPGSIHHVAIYLGGGYMIAAPHTGTVVQVQPVYASGFFGVTRVR